MELSEKETAGPGWTASVAGANTVSVTIAWNVLIPCMPVQTHVSLFP